MAKKSIATAVKSKAKAAAKASVLMQLTKVSCLILSMVLQCIRCIVNRSYEQYGMSYYMHVNIIYIF